MAIYHLTAKIVKRSNGQSAVAAAAYRSGSLLHEDTTGLTHDYTRKQGVAHSEILAPPGAPSWVFDRQTLWNTAEASERRKDAQVAREIEVGLPIELSQNENIALLRDFTQREFIRKGMVADIGMHLDNPHNPHAHILLTTRDLTATDFGPKNRSWNTKSELLQWRRGWAEVTNEHLIQAGLGVRIDHRSYADQRLDLIPGRKLGVGKDRQHTPDLPGFLADRVAEQQRIAGANGAQIIDEPTIALKALSHTNATFSHHDVARFLHTRTENAAQFQAAYLKVTTSPELVPLGKDDRGRHRFTTREMLESERRLLHSAEQLSLRSGHGVDPQRRTAVLTQHRLSDEQKRAVQEVTARGDLKSLVGVAGSGKSTTLAAMRQVWEGEGYTVKGAALAGIAAENLEISAGISSRTLASYELAWSRGRDPLTHRDILVIDEAGMLGTQQLERTLAVADKAHAKVVLVGDPEQLQAIEAGAPFRGIAATHGVSHLTEVRRQKEDWQRAATAQLATGKTADALAAYKAQGGIVGVERREDARSALLARWAHDARSADDAGKARGAKHEPKPSQLVLSFTREEVQALNTSIRALRQQSGQLGPTRAISTDHGKKDFSVHDRIRFGRNEKTLGVKNGSLGTIEEIDSGVLLVKLDGAADTRVAVDTKFYKHLDHGYATTVHKAQGTTVDRTYVLATPHFDRHTTYVALSRHREATTMFYATDDFGGRAPGADPATSEARLTETLSRARPKELAHDYLEREPAAETTLVPGNAVSPPPEIDPVPPMQDIDARQQHAAERWATRQHRPSLGQGADLENTRDRSPHPSRHDLDRNPELRRDGPEDDYGP